MSENRRRSQVAILLWTLGIAFAAAGLALWFVLYRPRTTSLHRLVLGVVVHVLFGYILTMSGILVYRSDLSTDECLIAAKRCAFGAALMGFLAVWGSASELSAGVVTLEFLNEFVIVSSVGAAAGVLVGLNRGQAVRNRRLVAEKAEREETLVFLLRLLDHDIQNHLMAISEYTEAVDPAAVDSRVDPVAGIRDRSADIERLLETANAVLESETGDEEFEPVDLSTVLREQMSVIQSNAPEIETRTRIDDGLYVESNQFVDEVFHNILDNAVTHNPPDDLTIAVAAAETEEGVVVEIADDGRGIPDQIRESVFDPGVRTDKSGGDGLGLYLVRKLVESYGGRVGVGDRSPTGTRFRVWFPKA
ncbi:HAMP domain-containing histidine kinase [Natronomonas sp. F2-12]|jgi:signal transduction histidine kinase|uniref:histidine kinase n=1 Tax=Natronomonas aquatica TaxID=2841590 RepID=A0A9R1CSJ7_9EURY|nr:HAMP domain-containing sensor histidine kinase [Natronomonas aquatica]MCQ4333212.1 HAMP domain-containing histidine kinase [Natronomonas aquatica]